MSGMTKQEQKEATKEAIKEWLDETFIKLGHWSLKMFIALIFGALVYFILWVQGWRKG